MAYRVYLNQFNYGTHFLETVSIQGRIYHLQSINRTAFALYNLAWQRITDFRGHTESVSCVATYFSEDICYIVSGSRDTTIRIWHSHTGHNIRTIRPELGPILTLKTYQHKGRTFIISGHESGALVFINPHTGDIVHHIAAAHAAQINCLSYYQEEDHTYIVSGGDDGKVTLWNADTFQACRDFPTLENRPIDCCTCFKNRYDQWIIVAAGKEKNIYLWQADDALRVSLLNQIGSHVSFCTTYQQANGQVMLLAANSGKIGIWHTDTDDLVSIERTDHFSPTGCSIYPVVDNTHLLITTRNSLAWYDLSVGFAKKIDEIRSRNICQSAFYQHGEHLMLVTAELHPNTIQIYNCDTAEVAYKFAIPYEDNSGFALFLKVIDSSSGKLLVAGHDNGPIYIWRIVDRTLISTFRHRSFGCATYTSADNSTFLITGDTAGLNSRCIVGGACTQYHPQRLGGNLTCFANYLHGTQQRLIVGTYTGKLNIIDPQHCVLKRELGSHEKSITCMMIYQDAGKNRLLVGSEDNQLSLWNLENNTQLMTFSGIDNNSTCCSSFMHKGERLFISGHYGNLLCCWDATGHLRGQPLVLPNEPDAIHCASDGIYVALHSGNLIKISLKRSVNLDNRVSSLETLAATAFKQRPDYLYQYSRQNRTATRLLTTKWYWPWD